MLWKLYIYGLIHICPIFLYYYYKLFTHRIYLRFVVPAVIYLELSSQPIITHWKDNSV